MANDDQARPQDEKDDKNTAASAVNTGGGVYAAGDVTTGGGKFIGRDQITVHDIKEAKGVAIGDGAQAIVNEIVNNITQQALSAVDEADKARANALRILAENVRDYAQRLTQLARQQHDAQQGGPYRGLIAYTLADAELFFGRRRATAELLEHMGANRLTVLQSESGAGKSSLLQASIAPQLLLNGHLPVILRPYDLSPSLKIKQTFLTGLETYAEFQAASLRDFLQAVTRVLGQVTTLYLVLDQFEEFFTLLKPAVDLTTEQIRTNFVDELATSLEDSSLNVRWVLAVRSEFFGDLAHFRPRIRNPFDNDYRLNRLTPAEAEAVITEPAAQYQIEFEPTLVNAILTELKQPDGQIPPPQIQLVCQALYQVFKDTKNGDPHLPNTITLAMYKQEGQAKGILGRYLNRVLSRTLLTKEEQDLARRLLLELVSSNQRRLRLSHSELAKRLATALIATQSLDAVLRNLVDTHLVIAEKEEEEAEATYQLAHDYLLSEIQVDPTVQAQKAAQELLQQEVEAYQRFKTLLSKEMFAIINSQRALLVLDEKAQTLLKLSEDEIRQEEYAKEAAYQRELEQAQQLVVEAKARRQAEKERAREVEARRQAEQERAEQANRDATRLRQRAWYLTGAVVLALGLAGVALYLLGLAQAELTRQEGTKLLQTTIELAASGNITKALTTYGKAIAADPTLPVDAETAITNTIRTTATRLMQEGEELARNGDHKGASDKFRQARALNPPADTPLYVWIAPGQFVMGSTEAECKATGLDVCSDEQPTHTVKLDGYWILRTEVTNAQYKRCVDAGMCDASGSPGWDKAQNAKEPVTYVDWNQAKTYAVWAGGRLPTEAEWEYACRGIDGRIYPWGNQQPAPDRLNYSDSGLSAVVDVGSYPPGANGLYDMAGNVSEWTSSVYKEYPYKAYDGREDPQAEGNRTFRGGAYVFSDYYVRCAVRNNSRPSFRDQIIGFRIVSSGF